MNVIGPRVAPLYSEVVAFDITTKGIIFSCSPLATLDILIGTGWGVMCEIDTIVVAVFVSLLPGTGAGADLVAGSTRFRC